MARRSDGTGRSGRSPADWTRLVAEYEHGELTRQAFCDERGLSVSSPDYWRSGSVSNGKRRASSSCRRSAERRRGTRSWCLAAAWCCSCGGVMFFPGNVRVYLQERPVDMRKSFTGPYALVKHVLEEDPLSGNLFVFVNRRGNYCLGSEIKWTRLTGFARASEPRRTSPRLVEFPGFSGQSF